MVLESLLVISLTLNFIFVYIFNETIMRLTLGITSLLWQVTGVLCFFTYNNSENKDFFGICLLLRIARITCIFFFIANIAGIVDDRDDFGYDYQLIQLKYFINELKPILGKINNYFFLLKLY